MKAVYVAGGVLELRLNYPQPQPKENEALIRVVCAGICSTDLEILKGYANFTGVLGHEFVGIVEWAAQPKWIGQRVVGGINLGCRHCSICLNHGPEHCPNRTVLGILNKDGIFAEYVTLPVVNLLPVPDHVTNEMAVFTEPLAAAWQVHEQLNLQPLTPVAVVGAGRLGMLVGQVLRLTGAQVTIIGRREKSLEMPAQLGFTTALTQNLTNNQFDVVVEATGNEEGFAQALRLVRPMGRMILKSTFASNPYAERNTLDLTKIVVDEITIIGSRCGSFAPALQLLANHTIETAPLINGHYSLDNALAAFAHADQPAIRKILLFP